jgi:branched-chain amino acid transport system permease protein
VKGVQEIAFGAILVGFILFMPGGIIGYLKEKVRGWEEPLHRARPGRRPPIAATSEGSEVRP